MEFSYLRSHAGRIATAGALVGSLSVLGTAQLTLRQEAGPLERTCVGAREYARAAHSPEQKALVPDTLRYCQGSSLHRAVAYEQKKRNAHTDFGIGLFFLAATTAAGTFNEYRIRRKRNATTQPAPRAAGAPIEDLPRSEEDEQELHTVLERIGRVDPCARVAPWSAPWTAPPAKAWTEEELAETLDVLNRIEAPELPLLVRSSTYTDINDYQNQLRVQAGLLRNAKKTS